MICSKCKSKNITLHVGEHFDKYECKECDYIGSFIPEISNVNPITVLIIGAGFAGLQTALSLKNIMRDRVSITMIDKNLLHLFVPGLDGYLINKLRKKNICINLLQLAKNRGIKFLQGKINKINPKKKEIDIDNKTITYDYLVVSIGSETNSFGVDGVEEHTHGLKTLQDAELLKQNIKELVNSRKRFNITIAGGGLTGVQLASHLRGYFDKKFKGYGITVSLLHSGNRLLNRLPRKVSKRVEDYFLKKKISIFLNSEVIKLEKNKIYLKSKQVLSSDLIIWAAGVCAPRELERFNLDFCAKGIHVNKYLQTITSSFIFALGDCISLKEGNLEKYVIKRAQNALKQGKLVARNIANSILNKKMIPYMPKEILTIVSLNNNSLLHYKGFIIQNRFVSILDKIIRLHYMLLK